MYVPELLLIGEWHNVVIRILLAFGSLYVFVAAIQGYLFVPLNILYRLGLGCLAVCLLIANPWIYLPAAVIAFVSVLLLRRSVGLTAVRSADHSARK